MIKRTLIFILLCTSILNAEGKKLHEYVTHIEPLIVGGKYPEALSAIKELDPELQRLADYKFQSIVLYLQYDASKHRTLLSDVLDNPGDYKISACSLSELDIDSKVNF